MTSIKFTNTYRDALGEKDYQLLIDEKVYEYIPSLDSLMDDKTGEITKRLNLPTGVLKAFHKAWNPMEYEGPHVTVDGVPDDTEDPDSPLYYPAKPEGDPMGVTEKEEKPTRSYTQRVVAHLVMNPNIW